MEKNMDICIRNIVNMANKMQNDQREFIEFNNLVVDYSDSDIAIFDHVTDITQVYPLKPTNNLIAVCTSGILVMKINGNVVKVCANDVFFCPPNLRIDNFESTNDFECKILYLSDHIIQGLLHDHISVWNHAVFVNHQNVISMSEVCIVEFSYYYGLLKSKIENHKHAQYDIMQAIIRALLLELCHILEKTPQTANDGVKQSQGKTLFNRFLRLIAGNDVKRRPITFYAGKLAITPKYLTMLCLKYSGKTASDWIVQYTIEDIRFYLRNSNLSIKEISAKLGFANMSHFGSYVRKHLGESPSSFRHRR